MGKSRELEATVIRAPAGLGKTMLVLKAIARGAGRSVEIYVPTHKLAKEVGEILRAANSQLTVKAIGGRNHAGADGKPLCKKHKLAAEIASAGGEVYSSLCARKKGEGEERCQHYARCRYIAQFKPAQVTIYPHAYLPLQRMRLEPPVPDIAIIDETFLSACIGKFKIPVSLLRAHFLGPVALRVCEEIERAVTQALPLLQHLSAAGISFSDHLAALKELRKGAPSMSPSMSPKARCAALQTTGKRNQISELLRTVWRDSVTCRQESHGLTYCAATQQITVHTMHPIFRRFQGRQSYTSKVEGRRSRVLIIDANADQQLISQFFKITAFHQLQTARQAEVIQCSSTRCSTTSLVATCNADPKSKREAKKRLHQVEKFIARLARQHPLLLVVGPQAITGNPNKKVKPLIKVPANVALAHFNAIRGIDSWKDHDAIVVIGRNEPPIQDVEAIARSVFLKDMVPLQFASEWTVEERGYRLKDKKFGVEVVRHPDPRVQAILEQLREGESQQAIDRLRLVHAPEPKRVYLLSNVVLDLDVNQVVTWDEMMNGGGRIEQAWNTLQGVMPLAPAWLAANFPLLWQTEDAAKADAAEWRKECRFTNIYSISNPTLFQHQYRPTGARTGRARQRNWSMCLTVQEDAADTRAALETLLGEPVEMRARVRQIKAA